jgi:hypothetical protein
VEIQLLIAEGIANSPEGTRYACHGKADDPSPPAESRDIVIFGLLPSSGASQNPHPSLPPGHGNLLMDSNPNLSI